MSGARGIRAIAAGLTLLAAATGCGEPRCEAVCQALTLPSEEGGCGLTTWSSPTACADGCEQEVFRRPDADGLLSCYEAAAGTCDAFALIRCRLEGGPVPDRSAF